MRRTLVGSAALLTLCSAAAAAQGLAEQVVNQLRAQGFTHVELDEGPTHLRVEGLRGREQVGYVHSPATGALVSRKASAVDGDVDRTLRAEYDPGGEAVVDAGDGGGDHGEDPNRGHDNDEDGLDDDKPGQGRGGDDLGRGRR